MKFSSIHKLSSLPSSLIQSPKHIMEWEALHSHSFPQLQLLAINQTGFQTIAETEPMVPNLDLIALGCLHGSFIALVLLIIIFTVLVVFCISSSLALLLVFVGDLYDSYSVLCVYYEEMKTEIELGLCLMVYRVMGFGVDVVLGMKSVFRQQNLRVTIRLPFPKMKVKEKWEEAMNVAALFTTFKKLSSQ